MRDIKIVHVYLLKSSSGQVNNNEKEIITGLCMKWTVDNSKPYFLSFLHAILITFTVFSLVQCS